MLEALETGWSRDELQASLQANIYVLVILQDLRQPIKATAGLRRSAKQKDSFEFLNCYCVFNVSLHRLIEHRVVAKIVAL